MRVLVRMTVAATLALGALLLVETAVSAMPYGLAVTNAELSTHLDHRALIAVRHRRGHRAAAFAAGAAVGGALAAPYYYRPYPSALYSPAYPVYGPYSAGAPAILHCLRRFRSYDPYTRTYLGSDGLRYFCP